MRFGASLLMAGLMLLLASCTPRVAVPMAAPTPRLLSTPTEPPAAAPSPQPPPRPSAVATVSRPVIAATVSSTRPSDDVGNSVPLAGDCAPLAGNPIRPRYRFNLQVDPQVHRLQVSQQVALTDRSRLATGEVVFNMPANHAPGVFLLQTARLAGEAAPLPVMLTGTTLRVSLPQAARAADQVTLCLAYALDVPPAGGAGISAAHALGWSDLGLIAGYWYPVLAPHLAGSGWLTIPYHPVGDPMVYETADYEVSIRAPERVTVIGAGLQEAKAGVWRFRLDRGRGFGFAVSERLTLTQGDAGGIPVRIYHASEHRAGAQAALRAVQEALPLFSRTYGPYPHAELVIVEAQQFGGMEYSALITFTRDWFAEYRLPAAGTDFGADMLVRFVVHELGHQWWYGAVGSDQAYEPWVDEALARYGEVLYYEKLHPAHVAWWEAPSRGMATQAINQPIYNFADTTSYVQAVYVSGTRFLLDVRKQMGEPAFTAFLQEYVRRNRDRLVTQSEFLTLLRGQPGVQLERLLPIYFRPVPPLP